MAAAIAVTAVSSATASDLQWRHAKPGAKPAAAKAETKPAEAKPHRDEAVQTVAFEEDQSAAPMRSMVVPRNSANNNPTASGAEESPAGAEELRWGQRNPAPDTRYEQQIIKPFGGAQGTDTNQGMEGLTPPANEPSPNQLPPTTEEELTLPESNKPPAGRQPGMERNPQGTQPETQLRNPPAVPRPRSYNDPFDSEPLPKPNSAGAGTSDDARSPMSVDCSGELAKIKARKLVDVNLNIAITGTEGEDFPVECAIDDGAMFGGRCWCDTTYMWKASALCHKPLYFEDEALERYGHSWGPCLDPIVSGAHFFCKLPVLPYCMGLTPPQECMYALGHYRPGDCAPYMINPVPLSCRAAAFEAGAWTGGAAIIP